MDYLTMLMPTIIVVAIFVFAIRRGFNRNALIVAIILGIIATIATATSYEPFAIITTLVINFVLFYIIAYAILKVAGKVRK